MPLNLLSNYSSDSDDSEAQEEIKPINNEIKLTKTDKKPIMKEKNAIKKLLFQKVKNNKLKEVKDKSKYRTPEFLSLDFEKRIKTINNDLKQRRLEQENKQKEQKRKCDLKQSENTTKTNNQLDDVLQPTKNLSLNESNRNLKPSQLKYVERDVKRFLESGGDISNLKSVSKGLQFQNITGETIQSAANTLAEQISGEKEDLLLRSVHLEASDDPNQRKRMSGEANKNKNQIGTLVQNASDYRLEFERQNKRNKTGASSAASKYGW